MTAAESPLTGIRAILLDIEGTVTPISFVHDILFPYARSRVSDYLLQHFNSPDVSEDVRQLSEEHAIDLQAGRQPPPAIFEESSINSIVTYITWLMDLDRKSHGLKSLQGKIWEQGYREGSLKAPIYRDVVAAMECWHRDGIGISIFSSGSVLAQKLLFQHTDAGDLTGNINHYFDTSVGKKTDPQSYRQIAATLSQSPTFVLFISDVVAELEAASAAGMKSLLCIRPGNPEQSADQFDRIETFAAIAGVVLREHRALHQ